MARSTEGAYSITSQDIDTSSSSLGAAISKAITYATRLQLSLRLGDDVQSIYVRKIGGETAARIDVRTDLIEVFAVPR